MFEALYILQRGFEQFGQERNEARARAAIYASALQGVSTQVLVQTPTTFNAPRSGGNGQYLPDADQGTEMRRSGILAAYPEMLCKEG